MRSRVLALVCGLLTVVGAVGPVNAATPGHNVEASMNFDQDGVEPFLRQVSGLLAGGFSASEAHALAIKIAGLKIDATLSRTYTVTFEGHTVPLRIEARMDDIDAPDLYFFSSEALATKITAAMAQFTTERRI